MAEAYQRTLHIANLQAWMDDKYLKTCFDQFGNEIVSVEIFTVGDDYRYGFVEFISDAIADCILKRYRGTNMPNASQRFQLNWSKEKRPFSTKDSSEEGILGKGPLPTKDVSEGGNYKLVVAGAIPKDVTAEELQQHFSVHFPSVKDAEVHTNESLELCGVITFADKHERDLATVTMPGQVFKRTGDTKPRHFFYKNTADDYKKAAYPEDSDPNGSTMYIQNLRNGLSEGYLRLKFSPYGVVTKVTIRASVLIQFSDRLSVNKALLDMNDSLILQNAPLPLTAKISNEKVKEGKQKEKEKQVVSAFSGQLDEEMLLSRSVGRWSAEKALSHINDDPVLQNSVESTRYLNELPLEDEEFRTCDEEFSDEKVAEEGKQNEEGTQVADAFSRKAVEETLLSKCVDRMRVDEALLHRNDDPVLNLLPPIVKKSTDIKTEEQKMRRREKKKGQKARKKERDKLLKQSNKGLEESGGQRIDKGLEASQQTNDGSEESEGEESNEGDQSVISWLLDLCMSHWQHLFR